MGAIREPHGEMHGRITQATWRNAEHERITQARWKVHGRITQATWRNAEHGRFKQATWRINVYALFAAGMKKLRKIIDVWARTDLLGSVAVVANDNDAYFEKGLQ
jgi:hypothetical protein